MQFEELTPAKTTTTTTTTSTSRALQQRLYSLLQTCKTLKPVNQIHTQILANGFSHKSFILVKLLSFYIIRGYLHSAELIFKNVENPSLTLWNQIVRGYSLSQTPRLALEMFNQMVEAEVMPNGFTYSFVLSGCVRSGSVREGEQVHARLLANGYCSNVFIMTNLVNLYGVVGGGCGIENARKVFDEMINKNVSTWNSLLSGYMRWGNVDGARRIFDEMTERNVVSWTTMISGYARNGKCGQALFFFNEMRRAGVGLDQVALVAALSACAELGDLQLGRWIHSYITETLSSLPLSVPLNNALIHMYASCGEIESAYEVFRWMSERSTVSWTSLIIGFAKHGYAEEALAVFHLMQNLRAKDTRPDGITFIGVLCACSHAGFVDEGRQFFNEMIQNWGITPRIEHYGCMVDLFSRAGLLDEAHNLIKNMTVKPNDAIWGAVLGGCRIHKNVELASHVVETLIPELDPQKAAGYFLPLIHVYATAKRWQDVAAVRRKMVEMGVCKPAGRSWVQIDGDLHDFMAGDQTRKQSVSIYDLLGKINREAKIGAYEPDILQVF